jgi:hypothetical protein
MKDKIQRELDMLARDLHGMRDAHLLRIIRNKRLPLSERYASLMIYEGAFHMPDNISDEFIGIALNQFLLNSDRRSL